MRHLVKLPVCLTQSWWHWCNLMSPQFSEPSSPPSTETSTMPSTNYDKVRRQAMGGGGGVTQRKACLSESAVSPDPTPAYYSPPHFSAVLFLQESDEILFFLFPSDFPSFWNSPTSITGRSPSWPFVDGSEIGYGQKVGSVTMAT